jgi:DNA-binding IclR family transcriptional regulator
MSISRAMVALRVIAGAPEPGLRSSDVSEALDLHKTSTSRLLSTLITLGAVERDRNRRYRITDGFRSIFGAPVATTRLRQTARIPLGLLSDRLEEVAFLSVPSGLDSLCVERHVGTYPIQALSLNVGSRRPLGVGAGSMALIAWLPDAERDQAIGMQRGRLGRYRIDVEDIAARAREARAQGFTDLPGFVVQGMTGMGVPIFDPSGLVIAALSVAAITERLNGERRDRAIRTLKEAAGLIEAQLRRGETGGPAESPDRSGGAGHP